MQKTGILIARLQTPVISSKLKKLLRELMSQHKRFFVVLAITKAGTTKANPLDFLLRKNMLREHFPDLKIFPLDDHPSDDQWSTQLDELIERKASSTDIVLYGSEDRLLLRYSGQHVVMPLGGAKNKTIKSPDEVLERNAASRRFREGIVYGLEATYPKVYPTVDMALFRSGRTEILLGMKSTDNKWRLPGGFTDPEDDSYETAVKRELKEECNISDITNLTYEASFKVDDWRYRFEKDKIITLLFSAEYEGTGEQGSDDLADIRWFAINDLERLMTENQTAPEHEPLFKHILNRYKNQN